MFNYFKSTSTAMDESKAVFAIAKILDSLDDVGRNNVLAWTAVHYPNCSAFRLGQTDLTNECKATELVSYASLCRT